MLRAFKPVELRVSRAAFPAILIHAIEPPLNRQGGRFGESVTRFLQVRDERLGKSVEDMVKEVYERGD
ncbi:hypothetical protein E3A20_04220 [Planctomyces bekefii]|uniref:Uncharacterized protein n=1 Tax=Planctomyces bekefii TaxID=1653850 RepID=A0A5C6MFR4_9PLAN|nr:hypothetical protein E3A20_04220 [Planctomyces bekefii]